MTVAWRELLLPLLPRFALHHRAARHRKAAVVFQGRDLAAGFGNLIEIDGYC